jgi:hypothetical protein
MIIPRSHIDKYKNEYSDPNANPLVDQDEENDVDMNNTMWLVLRKNLPKNETLKKFYAETTS